MGESFQKLNLTNAYLFAAALQDEEICRNLLEIVLNKEIPRVKAHAEHTLFLDSDFKSVRFDVYASDEDEVSYDVEMQNDDARNLPKRSRYYQGEMDVTSLKPGEDYNQLKPSYIIFICSFDPFGFVSSSYVGSTKASGTRSSERTLHTVPRIKVSSLTGRPLFNASAISTMEPLQFLKKTVEI